MKQTLKKSLILTIVLNAVLTVQAQVLPVGTPVLEEYYRRLQLLGKVDSTLSFSVRPLSNEALKQENLFDPLSNAHGKGRYTSSDSSFQMELLPIEWKNQVASNYPYGWNDGPMIPAKGFQTYLSAGFYASYKFLSIQFRPEFVTAQNADYDTYRSENERDWQIWWQRIANTIDAPERFGNSAYTRFLPGQSSIRLNFHPISIGISTENLWWGPGRRNSLLMSNTAPGFLHGTINTTRPIRTGIGSFEGQLVGGKLKASGFTPKILSDDDYHQQYYWPKPDDWRYFSGLIVSYQPKWVPGLTLGLINVFTVNSKDMGNKLGDYVPFFPSGSSTRLIDPDNPRHVSDNGARDQNISVFIRWVVPSVQFEIYSEYARNDRNWDLRDLVVSPNHSRSYLIGLRKLVPLPKAEEFLEISAEVTQLEQSKGVILRNTGPMYGHHVVRDGYTNLGQLLGAGVGMGNNLQSLNVSWIKGVKQLGVELERLVHNNDFLYRTSGDFRANWVDLGASANAQWNYKSFLFNARAQLTRAFNYQYRLEENALSPNFWNFRKQDKTNAFLQIGVMYNF